MTKENSVYQEEQIEVSIDMEPCNGTSFDFSLNEDDARRNFVKLLNYYDISFTFDPDKQTRLMKARDAMFGLIVEKIQKGKLEVIELPGGNVGIKQYLSCRSEKIKDITYRNVSGSDIEELSSKDKFAFLGSISKLGSKTFEKLTGGDLASAQLVDTFFRSSF